MFSSKIAFVEYSQQVYAGDHAIVRDTKGRPCYGSPHRGWTKPRAALVHRPHLRRTSNAPWSDL
jgi:hypothetical protein